MHPWRRNSWFALALALALASSAQAQSRPDRAEAYLRSFHDLRRFNGAALIVDEGAILFEGAFGHADFAGGIANSEATRFRIASLTKQFTAALILRLEEEGLLLVDDPVGRYIEEYPAENADRITLHHLLTHTSGLPSYTDIPGFMESSAATPLSPGEILALTWNEPLSFEPGTDFEYSNSGYVLLGWIAERVSGMSYPEALRTYVLEPRELTNTDYDHGPVPREDHAGGYTRDLTGYRPARPIDPSVPYSAGMLYSTVGDLARWGSALSHAHAGDASGALFRDSTTLARMIAPDLESYAYGIGVRTRDIGYDEDVRLIEHSGGSFGFSSFLRVFPDHRRLIALLDNTSSNLGPIVEGLTNVLWGVEAVPPKPSIAERLLPIIESGGVEAAMSRYDNWRRTRPDEYDYSPRQLMLLADHFREEDPATSIMILEAYVASTPEAPMIRFALSELHEQAGDVEAAAAHIEAALTYAPGVPRLLTRLTDLGVEPNPVLLPPIIPVEPEALAVLAGEYRIDPATTLTVTLEEGVLMVGRTGEEAFRLLPQSPAAFLLQGSAVQLVFEVQEGVAHAVSIVEAGQRLTFPRIGS
ncbi:serine hydrolase domain-containing protein [Candidatus Palauibacter sp.]|uniref:serine hydrolase domain-containing protein n=1 Tax=Candidatus Palauibacter sp. TaxID=3101350 RepID=UPI003B5A005E